MFLLFSCGFVFAQTYGVQAKTSGCKANQVLQDSSCTPGAVLSTSTAIICKSGYSATVRDVSTATRQKVFKEYGISWSVHSNYEVDHLISLEIGGSNDISNLWPESMKITDGSLVKDKLENYLHTQICSGKMTIQEAQKEISSNWLYYYNLYLNKKTTTTSTAVTITVSTPSKVTAPTAAPASNTSLPAVKKSSTGLCHAQGTRYYNQTLKYTTYDSISACLASGGKLPK